MEEVDFITAVRNAAYNEYGAITCEVQFEGPWMLPLGSRHGLLLQPHPQMSRIMADSFTMTW